MSIRLGESVAPTFRRNPIQAHRPARPLLTFASNGCSSRALQFDTLEITRISFVFLRFDERGPTQLLVGWQNPQCNGRASLLIRFAVRKLRVCSAEREERMYRRYNCSGYNCTCEL